MNKVSSKMKVTITLLIGVVAGFLMLGAFSMFSHKVNSVEFCISCHEMATNAYPEYASTIHYSNASGVRAKCNDCHISQKWSDQIIKKIYALREIYKSLIGTVDTPEKYEKHRLRLARRVWSEMMESSSVECRSCHGLNAMHSDKQSPVARFQKTRARNKGLTCIECHQGIAHKLPVDYDFDEELAKAGYHRTDQ